ncbi:hypothetical protein GCM10011369_25000 [Neiella marina]|uniref:Uncharacterized protein n=1 Tax=Neiella marina TaxID=508461 RepID=A0A8J2U6C1_9GAMM|nr:hypothetical protein GCM10011369_25000 [Neiella marina]
MSAIDGSSKGCIGRSINIIKTAYWKLRFNNKQHNYDCQIRIEGFVGEGNSVAINTTTDQS